MQQQKLLIFILSHLVQKIKVLSLEEDYTYNITNGEATIVSYKGPGGELIIPETLGGVPVVSIGDNNVFRNKSLTSVILPPSDRNNNKGTTSSTQHDLPETGENDRMTMMSIILGLILLALGAIVSIFRFKKVNK